MITQTGNDDACRLVLFLFFCCIWFIQRNERWLCHNQRGVLKCREGLAIKFFTKKVNKKREHIRGKQLLVHNRRNKWLVFALLVLSLDSPYSLSARCRCIVQLELNANYWCLDLLIYWNCVVNKKLTSPSNSAAASSHAAFKTYCIHTVKTLIACHENQFAFLHRAELKVGLSKVMKYDTLSQGWRLCLK